jgi:uncharacterized protein YbjT (DUF2867 family)
LITGATGQQGGAVARALAGKGFKLRAMTRKPQGEAAKALAALGAEITAGDLDDAASLEHPLTGAWGVFAVQTFWERGVKGEEEQGKRLAQLAYRLGVQHFVYSSVGSAHKKTGIPHFENKWRIEETVRGLKFPSHVILRPVFFMENLLASWLRFGDKIMSPLKPGTVLQMIALSDVGAFGAHAFTHASEMNRKEIDIAGDAVTMPQAAVAVSRGLGRPIEYVQIPIEDVRKNSEDFALMYEWFERVGYSVDPAALERTYGVRMTKLAEWVGKNVRP